MIVKVDVRTAGTLLWRAGEGVVALPFPKSPTESHFGQSDWFRSIIRVGTIRRRLGHGKI